MKKLIWVYAIAAVLAFHSGFAFAGTGQQAPAVKKGIQELLQRSEKASFEEIADIQSKLDHIRNELKNQKTDYETFEKVGRIQRRLDTLVGELASSMK